MGGAVVLADNALALPELPAADEVTLVNTVPSAMAELARARALPASVKVVNLAGEPLRRELADRIHELPGVEELWNLYGPSEDTTYSTGARIDRENRRAPAIGQPLPNSRAHLLDSVLRPVPVGVPGELWMGGEGVARGYLGRPDLTADRFRPDPFTTAPGGGRLYRTGDLARRRPDGEIEFLGRADHQVKIRGFRIEPGEVEALLGGHPQVSEAVVVARENAAGDPRLVAYVTAETDAGVLRAWLAARLPAHMVPASWVLLEEMPRTPNGKVDRKALPAPETETAAIEDDGPLSPAEQAVAEIWCEVLGLPRVSRHGNFFELGGHSLLAVRAASRLRDLAGADLPLRALFEAPTVAAMAARLELSGTVVAEPPVRRVGRDAPLPLSFTQERLWFIDQLEPGSAVYNLPLALRLRGPLDVEALGAAWDGIVRRHEALRTTFALVDGRPVQVIAPTAPPLERIDPENIEDEARRPFDLANGPLARAVLASIGEDDHLLLAVFHHAVFDGVSAGIFLRDLAALYAGETLPELPVQYADWAVWQRARLDGGLLGERLGFWREQLAGAPEALELPTDRPRPAVRSSRGAALPAGLPEGLLRALRTVAGRDGATLFMALLGGFAAVLQRWTGQDDAVIGSPVANRSRAEAEGLIGCLVNTLPLRVDASGDPSFRELLGRVRSTVLAASAHEDVPFERLVEELQPRRDLSRTPLFQAMLAFQDGPAARPELPGLTVADVPLHTGTAKFDLTLALNGDGTGGLEMDAGLFDAATGSRLLGHLETWLTAAAADPEAPIAGLPVLTAAESAQILEWHATEAAFPRDRGLHELFWDQAERTPGDVALIWGTERTSYGELRGRAEAIASRLRGEGVGPEVRVGVFSRRTPDLIAALLGVLRAGGAYVPLDPEYPPERLAFLLEDSGAAAVLVQEELISSLPPFAGRVLMLGGEEASERELPRGWIHPDQNAYLIYTSGSTGRPKAVAIRHESAVARVAWSLETYGERLARTLAATSVCFDLSVFEIFAPLAMGGAVVLADNALALPELPAADEVTLVNTVPSAMAELARARALPASVRVVNLAGEPLRRELADRVHELPGVEELWNLYGPSEDTTYSTAARIGKGDRQAPAVGRPLANSRVHLLDALLRPVPVGVPGEGWIAGDGVSRGYLGRPDLTADRFRPDPFATAPGGGRLYRTGDLLRRRPDGEIEFLGRADHQVKIRGFRIEPGEIEAVLGGHPHISEAVVIAREDVPGDLRLVAYVTATETDASELRAWLAARLPAHMVPAAWVLLEEMPRTPNGKVDRKALPAPEAAAAISDGDETLSPVEEVVAGIWCDVLGLTRVGRHDGFFELGGHSLLAAQVSARLRAAFGVEVPLHALFETPTVAGLAESVQGLLRTGLPPAPPLVPAPRSPEMPLSFAQERLWFIDQLEPGTPLY
ncbi:MAG TPA: amino acid adenylation domain-containing protein, partial [Thermoanaerobaculia bacterium]|nr:amino acid adenylation domain-containing protein [Thermoanaerobaculia bacterium]